MKRLTVLLLLLAILATGLASCGPKKPAATEATTERAAEITTDRFEVIVGEVRALPASDRSFKIEMSDFKNAEKDSKNDIYLAGPDQREGADSIGQKIYDRNKRAEEVLGVSVEYIYWDQYGWEAQAPEIARLVTSKAPDAPDVFVNMIFDLGNATMQGCFKDLWSIPGSYFDFNAKGWMTDWMKNMSLTGDRAYILAGDYFLDLVRAFGVLPFNATLMDANGSKLAPALFGENLAAGETMSQRFFDFVEDEQWTWDALGKLCEAVWDDKGTAGQTDIYDTLGILGDARSGMTTSFYLYSSGAELFESDTKDGKAWIKYPEQSTALGGIFDAVAGVFSGDGALATSAPSDGGASPTNPSVEYHWIKFGEGGTLFAGACVLGAMEDDAFQQMTDLYSVVPLPKVSADNRYNTIIHNVGDTGAINVNVGAGKAKALSAYLQFLNEKSDAIREEFLEIVTKYKTTVYNQGTDRMLDLIYASVVNGRDKAIEDLMRLDPECKGMQWHNYMKKDGRLDHDSSYIATDYAAARDAKQAFLDSILETWYGLPKAE